MNPPHVTPPAAPDHRFADGWAWLVLTCLARAYLAFGLTLVASGTLPLLGSWDAYVVRTASMEPTIRAGDLVLTSPLVDNEAVPVGRVVAFRSPPTVSPSPHDHVVIHRVVSTGENGTYVTAGDANASLDTEPLHREAVTGRGRLLVPYVGLPLVWWYAGSILTLAIWALGTIAAIVVVAASFGTSRSHGGPEPPDPPEQLKPEQPNPSVTEPEVHPRHRNTGALARRLIFLTAVLATLMTATYLSTASAAFTAETRNGGSGWTLKRVLFPYTAAVMADSPWAYYMLDENAGPTVTNSAAPGVRAGIYVAPITYQQAGAITSSTSYAVRLAGSGARAILANASSIAAPTTYSLELWFKTSTTAGGKLIGFENTTGATSGTADRHIFMRNDGRLSYGGWSGGGTTMITTPAAYNNNQWHHLVVTCRPNGQNQTSRIYVDGASRVSGTTTRTSNYSGYWRLGFGTLNSGGNYPTSANFAGTIDQVAIYSTELSAARVSAHYAAR